MQIIWLFVLSTPVACVAWTVTHEEIFKDPRDFCLKKSLQGKTLLERKFFYLFTCEYCFSHYVVVLFLFLTDYKLLMDDWRGYVISGFALVWIANVYINLLGLIRQAIKKEKTEIEMIKKKKKLK